MKPTRNITAKVNGQFDFSADQRPDWKSLQAEMDAFEAAQRKKKKSKR